MNIFKNEKTIEAEFSTMLSLAKDYFETDNHKNFEYHKCLVLTTAQGEQMTYPIASDSIEKLINQECAVVSELEKEKKTEIKKIVCMWEGKVIDVPSFQFMKKLCELNTENKKTEILLKSRMDAYVSKKIADIIG